jgi:hypothetical protein
MSPRSRVTRLVGVWLLAGVLVTAGMGAFGPEVAGASGIPAPYTCSGGTLLSPRVIPAGTYGSVTVADGFCVMQGRYDIVGALTVAPGAFLDAAVFFGFPPYDYGEPCNVFVNVAGGVHVGANAALYFGNGPGTGCPGSNDVVNGGLIATNAESVVVHGTKLSGGVSVSGGGGGTDCAPTNLSPFAPYTDIEDSQVNGGATISGLSTCWTGFIRNKVNGAVTVNNNTMGDPDAIEIGINAIHGGLACSGNALAFPGPGGVPTNSFDGSPPNPNAVTGAETGQCAGL